MLRSIIPIAITACLHCGAVAQGLEIRQEASVIQPATQRLVVRSKALDKDMVVTISPPVVRTKAGDKAAIVYLLDGYLSFGLASDTLQLMALEKQTWPAYLVTISYNSSNPNEIALSRDYDYLHSVLKHPDDDKGMGGGGAKFEAFVVDELKPFIEARLPIDADRSILAGFSHGGLFVANLIARRPQAFDGYMIGSPSIWADARVVSAVAKAGGNGKPVYLGVGGKEVGASINTVADTAKLGDSLQQAGFVVTERVFEGQTHGMTPNSWIAEGFRTLLARPKS